jgi:SagB-type dehydrogenase family enzyme
MERKVSRRDFLKASATTGALLAAGTTLFSFGERRAFAKELQPIQLSKPQAESGNPVLRLLTIRTSSREFSPQPLPLAVLSNLLWAAFGISRADGRRTAPSAHNFQDIDIYVAVSDGLYLYDPKANALKPMLAEDIRVLTGTQPFVKDVPVNLIYVSDYAKMGKSTDEEKIFFSGAHTGVIAENVYLYCASEGLATAVRALIDKPALAKAMKLRPDQKITLAQSVGYPRQKG